MCGKLSIDTSTQDVKMIVAETIRREDLAVELAWLAGVIDGEGNINLGFYGNGQGDFKVFRLSVQITNTHMALIEKATKILEKCGLFFKVHARKRSTKWRPCVDLFVAGQKNAYKLLKLVEPFLTCKKETAKQAMLAYEYRLQLRRLGESNTVLAKNPILIAMCERHREIVAYRPNFQDYSLVASKIVSIKKPSETTRLTAITAEDIVRSLQ